MHDPQRQIVVIIIAITIVLLFIGVLFLVMIWAYNNKKVQMAREKQQIQDAFEKQLLQSRLEIQEETFNAISQEIHDNVGQLLSCAKVQLNVIGQQHPHEVLKEVKDNISEAFTALRNIARSLSSERLQMFSLADNVREEMRRMERAGVDMLLSIEGAERPFNNQSQMLLFRMVQESLQNILKHAQASTVTIRFQYLPEAFNIIIHDNGTGFDVTTAFEQKNGLGLRNILHRARLIGGTAQITSNPAAGTSIHITTPYA